jgi:hypothetical protein
MTAFQQIAGNGLTHVAKSQEADFHQRFAPVK